MLVDLGRNDLGRVSKYGSVRVDELMIVERYSHVMHIVSTVSGELETGKTPLDALAATLPMGTVSGAPKIRAMESMDMALTLRTALVKDGMIHIQAGGGVVADSDPSLEFEESVNKAKALRRAVELAEAGL
jgi:anthranilate synthase component I